MTKAKKDETAQAVNTTPAQEPETATYPDWQTNGLKALVEAGVIVSPEYWEAKFGQSITVGEVVGIPGKLFEKATE